MGFIDRFCERFPRFGIPHLMRFIVFGMGLVYIQGLLTEDGTIISWLLFSSHQIMDGQVWRLISFIFVPYQSNPIWFAVSLYVAYMIGTSLERAWGTAKFTLFILFNILVLAGAGMIIHFAFPFHAFFTTFFVSGYFIQSFLIFAFITLSADSTFQLYLMFPIRASLLGLIMGGALIYELFFGQFFPQFSPLNLLPFVLLLPYLIFCGPALFGRSGGSQRPQTTNKAAINFHRAKKKVEQKQAAQAYKRKCEVCGKTDTEYPDMEFRYCSRCDGYHCYCMDHINNHEHR